MDNSEHLVNGIENGSLTLEKCQRIFDNIHFYNCISFALTLAKDVGIIDTLLEASKSMTSQEIADSRGLKERYTREILACLVSVRMLEASLNKDGAHVYYVGDSAKKVLSDGINRAEMIMPLVFATSYQNLKECISLNGPPGFSYCDKFLERLDQIDKDDEFVDLMLDNVPNLKTRLGKGIRVLEFGSGCGSMIRKLASKYPQSTFTASEMNVELETILKNKLQHVPNVETTVLDISALPEDVDKQFDWIFLKNCTHVVPKPGESLKGIRRRVAEPDGLLTFIDFVGKGDPLKSVGNLWEAGTYSFSLFTCLPLSFCQNENSETHGCCWSKETAIKLAREANFEVETFPYMANQFLFLAKPI